jgi:hypothetical protein
MLGRVPSQYLRIPFSDGFSRSLVNREGGRRAPALVAYPRWVEPRSPLFFVNVFVNGSSLGTPALRLDNDGRPLGALNVLFLGSRACPPASASGPASSAFGLTTSQPASPRFTPTLLEWHAKHARGAAERLTSCAKQSVSEIPPTPEFSQNTKILGKLGGSESQPRATVPHGVCGKVRRLSKCSGSRCHGRLLNGGRRPRDCYRELRRIHLPRTPRVNRNRGLTIISDYHVGNRTKEAASDERAGRRYGRRSSGG